MLVSFAEGCCELHKQALTLCSSTNQSQRTSNLSEYLVFGNFFAGRGTEGSRADAHAHKKWQCTVAEGEEYRMDQRVCVQARLFLGVMIFFWSGGVGWGGGGAGATYY